MELRDKIKTRKGYSINMGPIAHINDCRLFIESGTEGQICEIEKVNDVKRIGIKMPLTTGVCIHIEKLNENDIILIREYYNDRNRNV